MRGVLTRRVRPQHEDIKAKMAQTAQFEREE